MFKKKEMNVEEKRKYKVGFSDIILLVFLGIFIYEIYFIVSPGFHNIIERIFVIGIVDFIGYWVLAILVTVFMDGHNKLIDIGIEKKLKEHEKSGAKGKIYEMAKSNDPRHAFYHITYSTNGFNHKMNDIFTVMIDVTNFTGLSVYVTDELVYDEDDARKLSKDKFYHPYHEQIVEKARELIESLYQIERNNNHKFTYFDMHFFDSGIYAGSGGFSIENGYGSLTTGGKSDIVRYRLDNYRYNMMNQKMCHDIRDDNERDNWLKDEPFDEAIYNRNLAGVNLGTEMNCLYATSNNEFYQNVHAYLVEIFSPLIHEMNEKYCKDETYRAIDDYKYSEYPVIEEIGNDVRIIDKNGVEKIVKNACASKSNIGTSYIHVEPRVPVWTKEIKEKKTKFHTRKYIEKYIWTMDPEPGSWL